MTLALDRPTPTTASGAATLPPVVGAGVRVPLVTGGWVDYANLDLAASGPALQSVADHVAQVLPGTCPRSAPPCWSGPASASGSSWVPARPTWSS